MNTIILGPSSLLREGVAFTICRAHYSVTTSTDRMSSITSEAWARHLTPSLTVILVADPLLEDTADIVRSLRERRPSECIVVLCARTGCDEESVLQAGANACIASSISPDVLIMSLNLLVAKEVAMAALAHREDVVDLAACEDRKPRTGLEGTRIGCLTRRELDVLQGVAMGHSNKLIASRLAMREPTVKSHMRLILKKIGSNNRTQAATWAVANGLSVGSAKIDPVPGVSFAAMSVRDGVRQAATGSAVHSC